MKRTVPRSPTINAAGSAMVGNSGTGAPTGQTPQSPGHEEQVSSPLQARSPQVEQPSFTLPSQLSSKLLIQISVVRVREYRCLLRHDPHMSSRLLHTLRYHNWSGPRPSAHRKFRRNPHPHRYSCYRCQSARKCRCLLRHDPHMSFHRLLHTLRYHNWSGPRPSAHRKFRRNPHPHRYSCYRCQSFRKCRCLLRHHPHMSFHRLLHTLRYHNWSGPRPSAHRKFRRNPHPHRYSCYRCLRPGVQVSPKHMIHTCRFTGCCTRSDTTTGRDRGPVLIGSSVAILVHSVTVVICTGLPGSTGVSGDATDTGCHTSCCTRTDTAVVGMPAIPSSVTPSQSLSTPSHTSVEGVHSGAMRSATC